MQRSWTSEVVRYVRVTFFPRMLDCGRMDTLTIEHQEPTASVSLRKACSNHKVHDEEHGVGELLLRFG